MHTYVYCDVVHSSKDLEPTQTPINVPLDKEKVVHIDTEYYAAIKKNVDMDGARSHYP